MLNIYSKMFGEARTLSTNTRGKVNNLKLKFVEV